MRRDRGRAALLLASLWLSACGGPPVPQAAKTPGEFTLSAGIQAAAPGLSLAAAMWLHPRDLSHSLLVGAAGAGGLTLHDEAGQPRGRFDGVEPDFVAVAHGFDPGEGPEELVVIHDRSKAGLVALTLDAVTLEWRVRTAHALPIGTEATGLCVYRSPASGRHYVFVADGEGQLQQWELRARRGRIEGHRVKQIALGTGIAACAVDEVRQTVYVADEAVGIWRVNAEPESDPGRELVDRTGTSGHLGDEVKGLAIYADTLLAMSDDGVKLNAYALPGTRFIASITPVPEAGDLGDMESIWAGALGEGRGAEVVFADPESSSGSRWRKVSWGKLADALGIVVVPAGDPRLVAAPTARWALPTAETVPVDDFGDAADDPAIWVHPVDPSRSLIITAQKKRGLQVHDLRGRSVQLLADGRMNNVDLRQRVDLGNGPVDVIAASNRTQQTLALYTIDAATGRLRDIADGPIPTGMRDPYGLCMYRSARDGAVYVFVNNSDRGEFRQWRLEAREGRIGARVVREFTVGSQAEGCVADDDSGALYIAEEDVGLWRYSAEPQGGAERTLIGSTDKGHLAADVEGLAIYRGIEGRGYLVVSNQGADNYAVYRREGNNAFVGHFSIGANDVAGIDGASETDGLEVTAQALGPDFPGGLLVVQDGRNFGSDGRQNYKLVPWDRVATALGL